MGETSFEIIRLNPLLIIRLIYILVDIAYNLGHLHIVSLLIHLEQTYSK